MSEQTKTVLKGYFETGDTPSQSNFADLIDTLSTESYNAIQDGSIGKIFLEANRLVARSERDSSKASEIERRASRYRFSRRLRSSESAYSYA